MNWLALACGLPFWLLAAYSLGAFHHMDWSLPALGFSVAGIVFGLIGIIATRARSAIAWWGFSLSAVPVGLILFFIVQ